MKLHVSFIKFSTKKDKSIFFTTEKTMPMLRICCLRSPSFIGQIRVDERIQALFITWADIFVEDSLSLTAVASWHSTCAHLHCLVYVSVYRCQWVLFIFTYGEIQWYISALMLDGILLDCRSGAEKRKMIISGKVQPLLRY